MLAKKFLEKIIKHILEWHVWSKAVDLYLNSFGYIFQYFKPNYSTLHEIQILLSKTTSHRYFLDFILNCAFFSPSICIHTPPWNVHTLILPEKYSCWWEVLFSREVLIRHITVAKFILGFEYQSGNIDLYIVFCRETSEWSRGRGSHLCY